MFRALIAVALICPIPLQPTKTSFVTAVWIGAEGPLRFLVDTGATTTVIDRKVAQRIGLKPVRTIAAVTTTGPLDVSEAVVEELRAGEERSWGMSVLIADLPHFPNHGRLDGLLGMNAFAGRALNIDVRGGCIELDANPPRGATIAAREIAGRVAIEVEGLSLILDSGASFPVLTSPRARALATGETAMELTSASGRQRATKATVPLLRIGHLIFRDITVALAPQTDAREDGLLPITPFHNVYIAADRKSVIVN